MLVCWVLSRWTLKRRVPSRRILKLANWKFWQLSDCDNFAPDPLSNDLSGVDKIVQDGSVYSHQGAGPGHCWIKTLHTSLLEISRALHLPWTLLLKLVGLPGRLGQDPPLGNKYHMLARELLLKLPHQPIRAGHIRVEFKIVVQLQCKSLDLVWIFWKALSWGTGTKTTMAFLPPEHSTCIRKPTGTGQRLDEKEREKVASTLAGCEPHEQIKEGRKWFKSFQITTSFKMPMLWFLHSAIRPM